MSALSFALQPEMEESMSLLESTKKLKRMDVMRCTFPVPSRILLNWFVEVKGKVIPLHAIEVLGVTEGIAPIHS
jgi:hypothetical protein